MDFNIQYMENQIQLNTTSIIENESTFDLLDKIKHSPHGESIGPMPLSLQVRFKILSEIFIFHLIYISQACRFELPFDLKLLENLSPLEYLSKHCRLSSRRQYEFKRVFNKYRNKNNQFDSSNLYLSLFDLHKQNLTLNHFNDLCQLIHLNNQSYQLTFNIYAGILALFERILYKRSLLHKDQDDYNLTKDIIEKCDFYSLQRKFHELKINDTLKKLLNEL